MAKFPTEVESTVTVHVPLLRAYDYLWDVVGSSHCIPGLDSCVRVGSDTYRFVYAERSTGPLSIVVRYTARYTGNHENEIAYEGTAGGSDNTDVSGVIRLRPKGDGTTQITLRQRLAPDTPVPRLLQGLVRSFAESEARAATKAFLANVKAALESPG